MLYFDVLFLKVQQVLLKQFEGEEKVRCSTNIPRKMRFCILFFFVVVSNVWAFSAHSNRLNSKLTRFSSNNELRFNLQMALDTKPKKVVVLGGDGFCGWPTSLYLSDQGHEVIVVDNLSRRKIDIELGCDSLTPIAQAEERVRVWNSVSKNKLQFKFLDLQTDYAELVQFLLQEKPDTVVHFAEQRAAPYSMKDARRKRYTIDNNLSGTHNLLCAIVESGLDIHVVHLGTMGESSLMLFAS